MSRLDALEAQSTYILREAYKKVSPCCLLWSMGKDSTTLLWLCRKAFFGRVPFPVVLLDTGDELEEVYAFRDRYVVEWDIESVNVPCVDSDGTDLDLPANARLAARKSLGLKRYISAGAMRGVIVGIRRDEQAVRGKERVFSPRDLQGQWNYRDQPPELWGQYTTEVPFGGHLRIHPLLAWTELDVWRYVRRENIPMVSLYFARDGARYRSLGEKAITRPVPSKAATLDEVIEELEMTQVSERAGRVSDRETEDAFERLRERGYM